MKRKRASKAIVHQPAAQFYEGFVEAIKERIRTAQIKAALAANAQLVLHYWEIGRDILVSQKREGWGAKVIDRLASDLQREFPKLSGYSARNLKYMRAFAEAWPDREIVQQLAAQIPWGQNCVLLDRVKDAATRAFYIRKTVEHGWSRGLLIHQLDTNLHTRLGKLPQTSRSRCRRRNPIPIARLVAADTHQQKQIEALIAALQKIRAQLEPEQIHIANGLEQSVKLPSNYQSRTNLKWRSPKHRTI